MQAATRAGTVMPRRLDQHSRDSTRWAIISPPRFLYVVWRPHVQTCRKRYGRDVPGRQPCHPPCEPARVAPHEGARRAVRPIERTLVLLDHGQLCRRGSRAHRGRIHPLLQRRLHQPCGRPHPAYHLRPFQRMRERDLCKGARTRTLHARQRRRRPRVRERRPRTTSP